MLANVKIKARHFGVEVVDDFDLRAGLGEKHCKPARKRLNVGRVLGNHGQNIF